MLSPAKFGCLSKTGHAVQFQGWWAQLEMCTTQTAPLPGASTTAYINSSCLIVQNHQFLIEANLFTALGFSLPILKWSSNGICYLHMVLVFGILKYFCTIWRIVCTIKTSHWWHCTTATLDRHRSGSCSTDQGDRDLGMCSARPWLPRSSALADLSHRAGGANDSGMESVTHNRRAHWHPSTSQPWQVNSTSSPSSARIRCQGLPDNLMGKFMKGSDAYVKPWLRNEDQLASDKDALNNVQNQLKNGKLEW